MKNIKLYESWIKESISYDIDPDKYTDPEIQRSIADNYIDQIERATKSSVKLVEGSLSETDCDLYFELEDGVSVTIEVIYAPYGGLTKVSINDGTNRYEKSFGKIERYGSNEYGKNKEYEDVDDPIYHMVNDLYREHGLIEISYTHEIKLPKELFSNDPYFHYDSDDKGDQHVVYFESEEAAQAWINSLKIYITEGK
jgi:hypothetical protein